MNNVIRHPWTVEPTRRESIPTGADLEGLVEVATMQTDGGYPIGVLTADGSHGIGGRALHIQAPWSEAVLDRPDAQPRALAFAKAMGAQATLIDAPGIGVDAPRLPSEVLANIRHGNLHDVARMQASVAGDVFSAQSVDELYGVGTSQGAIMLGASMATAAENVHYNGVVFFESPGLFRQNPALFAGRFAVDTILQPNRTAAYRNETPGEAEYVPGNTEHMRKLGKAILQHPSHYMAYIAAMSRDGLERDIAMAYERDVINSSTELVFVTGTDSTVSPVEWNAKRALSIRQTLGVGGVHLITLFGENHAMYESPRMHAVLKRIREEIFAISSDAA